MAATRTMRGRAPAPSATPLSTAAMRVAVVRGRDAGQFVAVPSTPGDKVTIGAGRGNDLVLHDERVSARHLEVGSAPEGVTLRDLGSATGTFLGATRIGDGIVPPGTRVRLGETVLEIVAGEITGDLRARLVTEGLVFSGPAMTEVAESLQRLAPFSTSVLIEGETGTGKEVIARAVHRLSMRANGPFVVVDCGALPAALIESELFGHERGAFTGAERRRQGAFERAHGGTVFLDEIGELPLASQPALLGALQRRKFRRVGGHDEVEVDVRLVAATNRALLAEVERGAFRADLYYRLATAGIWLPPLRRRLEDLPVLIASLLTELTGSPLPWPFDESAMEALRAHPWPGNVRELRAVVERAVMLGRLDLGGPLGGSRAPPGRIVEAPPRSLSLPAGPVGPYGEARAEALSIFEKDYLRRLIQACEGNASEAARVARMDRPHLLRLLRRHGLR
ncbi:MAG: sigma 54-interacting transcriptional regulator [Byssovorax sp.]